MVISDQPQARSAKTAIEVGTALAAMLVMGVASIAISNVLSSPKSMESLMRFMARRPTLTGEILGLIVGIVFYVILRSPAELLKRRLDPPPQSDK